MPEIDLNIREQLNQQFANEGIEPIRKQLAELYPEYFAKVDQSNPQRMIRGLEVVLSNSFEEGAEYTGVLTEAIVTVQMVVAKTDRNTRFFFILIIDISFPFSRIF